MVFPWIPFLFGAKKRLSDIEYLSIKEFDGKRVDVDNSMSLNDTSTETDLVTQTASSGKERVVLLFLCACGHWPMAGTK